MKRRAAAVGLAATLVGTSLAHAQTPRPTRKIGYIHPRSIAPDHPTLAILSRAWQQLGYVEGETVLLRSAQSDPRRLPGLVAELIGLGVVALIVVGAAAVKEASRVTKSVPLVCIDLETDPLRAGLAASYARPGGNVTGLFLDLPSLAGKWIELLLEAAPDIERFGLVWDRSTGVDQLEIAKAVARSKGFETSVIELNPIRSFDDALRVVSGKPRTGIVALSSPGFVQLAVELAAAARRYRLPTIAILRAYAQAGTLMSYGPVQELYFARAVAIAHRIANGEKPGELPIEGPDRFQFVINLGTARSIGLSMTQALLLRADEVIE